MKNNIWFFGDSFTYGEGCRLGFEYYEEVLFEDKKLWTTIVADSLNLNEKNLGIRGGSTPSIIHTLISNLPNIKKNDYVIIGDSLPTRTFAMNEKMKKVRSVTTDIFEQEYGLHNFFESTESQISLLNYINSNIIPYSKEWKLFYETQIESLQKYLLKNNVMCYYWSHLLWAAAPNRYHTINKHTDSKIKDNHFSWIGHLEFSKYILKAIENKKYIIHRSKI